MRYKFFEDIYDKNLGFSLKGFLKEDVIEQFKTDRDTLYVIPLEEEYRPDLIAKKFYNRPDLFWVLVYINGIGDSPEGFYKGRVIRIPRYERVIELT